MTMHDAVDLFCHKSDCQMAGKDAAYCYGMSKMTNIQENTEP